MTKKKITFEDIKDAILASTTDLDRIGKLLSQADKEVLRATDRECNNLWHYVAKQNNGKIIDLLIDQKKPELLYMLNNKNNQGKLPSELVPFANNNRRVLENLEITCIVLAPQPQVTTSSSDIKTDSARAASMSSTAVTSIEPLAIIVTPAANTIQEAEIYREPHSTTPTGEDHGTFSFAHTTTNPALSMDSQGNVDAATTKVANVEDVVLVDNHVQQENSSSTSTSDTGTVPAVTSASVSSSSAATSSIPTSSVQSASATSNSWGIWSLLGYKS
jgi:hypothetical protein